MEVIGFEWVNEVLFPEVFANLPAVFPEFDFVQEPKGWKARNTATTKAHFDARADRVVCYRQGGFFVRGQGRVSWLGFVLGKVETPTGSESWEAVKLLAQRAGIRVPTRELSAAEVERRTKITKDRHLLEELVAWCHSTLVSGKGKEVEAARAYLQGRHFTEAELEAFEVGFLPKGTRDLVQWVESKGWKWAEVEPRLLSLGVFTKKAEDRVAHSLLEGRIVGPWYGLDGQVETLWGRYVGKPPQDADRKDLVPKVLYLKDQAKVTPYLLDRANKGQPLVIVEGIFDAIRVRGLGLEAVALGGTGINEDQVRLLSRHFRRPVILALDGDAEGRKGTERAVGLLLEKTELPVHVLLLPAEPGAKVDPDLFIEKVGEAAARAAILEAPHALSLEAEKALALHRGERWTELSKSLALQDAHDVALKVGHRLEELDGLFWPKIAAEIDLDAVKMREAHALKMEKKAEETRAKASERLTKTAARKVEDLVAKGMLEEAGGVLLEAGDQLRDIRKKAPRVSPRTAADELEAHEAFLRSFHGKTHLGLAQDHFPLLDEYTQGLRGLVLMAGQPGTGKTAFGTQLGVAVIEKNPDAVFVFVSLEMKRMEMMTRIRAELSRLETSTLLRGSFGKVAGKVAPGEHFTDADLKKKKAGDANLRKIGDRLLILDTDNFPEVSVDSIVDQVEALKEKAGAERAFVLVDYLQVFPLPDSVGRNLRTDLERDKWQIGQLRELRDRLGREDAVMVVSEASKGKWEDMDMSAVMGSARGTYTPDMVLLLTPAPDSAIAGDKGSAAEKKEAADKERERLLDKGETRLVLRIVKGRDGVRRGTIPLAFNFRMDHFEEGEE